MFNKFAVLLFVLVGFSVNADVVKWVDKQGKVHYSNKVPKKYKKSSKRIKFVEYKKTIKTEDTFVAVAWDDIDWSTGEKKSDSTLKEKVIKKSRQRKAKKMSITELRAACDIAREKRLAPARAEAIEECITKNKRQTSDVTAYCERFNRTFGDESYGVSNWRPYRSNSYRIIRKQRLFHNIPECRRLYKAEDKRKGE